MVIIQNNKKTMPYYAVAKGNQVGIFSNWSECRTSIHGYKMPKFKKFDTEEDALQFIKEFSEGNIEHVETYQPDYYVYTDGSCHGNGKTNASAGIGIFFGENDERNVSREIEGKKTNNVAELTAIIETFNIIQEDINNGKHITIGTDSEYAMKCATTYGKTCAASEWTKDIPNKELVKTLYELYRDQDQVRLMHIKAHTNKDDPHSIGNAHADRLANEAIGIDCTKKVYSSNKIYLDVPYKDKEIIKAFEGKWDKQHKMWYILNHNSRKEQVLKIFQEKCI